MIKKELKKLSRRELVDILYQMKKNEQQQQEEIASLQEALQDRRIRLSMAGSISEAAASITNLFSTAQSTADLYLSEITSMREETEKECAKMLEEAEEKVEKILAEGEKACADLYTRYQADYKKWKELQAEINTLEEMRKRGC